MNRAKDGSPPRSVNFMKRGKKMKKRFKIMSTLLALLTLLLGAIMPIQAAVVEPDVEPAWENTSVITLTLTFPDDGYAEATICGELGVTKIVIDVYVYRQVGSSWVQVGEKHATFNDMDGEISCRFNSINRAYYKAHYIFTVTKDGYDEVISKTQYKTCSQ